jgi:hypothetical protein
MAAPSLAFKSHQRQLVDGSNPAYKKEALLPNPTNGSWWMVQIQPTAACLFPTLVLLSAACNFPLSQL